MISLVVRGAHLRVAAEVSKWEGVEGGPHRFGGTEFKLGRRELGHLHGDYQADIPFPIAVRNRLIAEGKAEPHHILSQSGWITFRFRNEADVGAAIRLFRMSYELACRNQRVAPQGTTG
ncbi:MAG: DUF5519 family protein [Thaumarchaeota archaeon]|nr:DUF5519 family protein [Nitrososphaerota archaeon]